MPFEAISWTKSDVREDMNRITIAISEERNKSCVNSVKILFDWIGIIAELKDAEKPDTCGLD
jgi:hypothetical protein